MKGHAMNPTQVALHKRFAEHRAELGQAAEPETAPLQPTTFSHDNPFGRIASRRSEPPRRRGAIVGSLLKYNGKTGVWELVEAKEILPDGTQVWLISMAENWTLWQGGQPVDYAFERPDGSLPARAELQPGHNDKSLWAISSLTGEPADPWERRICALASLLGDQYVGADEVTIVAASDSAVRVMRSLAAQVAYFREHYNPEATAILRLGGVRKGSGVRSYFAPRMDIVTWCDAAGLPLDDKATAERPAPVIEQAPPAQSPQAKTSRVLPDDEIPF
jgi:hypothetical protein